MKKTVITSYIAGKENGTIINARGDDLSVIHTSCNDADIIYFYNMQPLIDQALALETDEEKEEVSLNSFRNIAGFLPAGMGEEININWDEIGSVIQEGIYFDKMFYLLTKQEKDFIANKKQHVYDVKMFNKITEKSNLYGSNEDIEKTFTNPNDTVEIFYIMI